MTNPTRPRRSSAALPLLALLSVSLACHRQEPAASAGVTAAAGVALEPYSVQLHVHGSFSEGLASIDSHSYESSRVGLDVLWWSDHDWRIQGYRHTSSFEFDNWSAPLDDNEAWQSNYLAESTGKKKLQLAEASSLLTQNRAHITSTQVFSGTDSLRLEALSPDGEFQRLSYEIDATRGRFRRPLAAGVTLNIVVYADTLGIDNRAFLDVLLSLHTDFTISSTETFALRYELDNSTTTPTSTPGLYTIPLAYTPGTWNAYSLQVTQDAQAGFPGFDGEDNSLRFIAVGVESRNGATAIAYFDEFELQTVLTGEAVNVKQRQMLQQAYAGNRDLAQLQGVELSYFGIHMNEFSLTPGELPNYDAMYQASGLLDPTGWIPDILAMQVFIGQHLTKQAHDRGSLISVNHMFGTNSKPSASTPTKESLLAELLSTNVYGGADILEVGYRQREGTLAEHLWVWDELAKNGQHLLGTGVTDSHAGYQGEYGFLANNFVSWIYSTGPERTALLDGMKRGRIFFGDISLFDGSLDITTPTGWRMGQVVLSDAISQDIEIDIEGINSGDVVRLVRSGAVIQSYVAAGSTFSLQSTQFISPSTEAFFRVEVVDPSGVEKVFSNPLTFVRSYPDAGFRGERAAFELGGVRSVSFSNFTFHYGDFTTVGAGDGLILTGEGAMGGIVIDTAARGAPTTVEFNGFGATASWYFHEGLLRLKNLDGHGQVTIVF